MVYLPFQSVAGNRSRRAVTMGVVMSSAAVSDMAPQGFELAPGDSPWRPSDPSIPTLSPIRAVWSLFALRPVAS
jgi:hypothetical protein